MSSINVANLLLNLSQDALANLQMFQALEDVVNEPAEPEINLEVLVSILKSCCSSFFWYDTL